MLLDAGANVNAPEGYAIQAAAAQGHYEVVEELLKRGADVNALTTNENFAEGTALQGATEHATLRLSDFCLNLGQIPTMVLESARRQSLPPRGEPRLRFLT